MKKNIWLFWLTFALIGNLFAQTDSAILLQGVNITEGRSSQTILSTTPIQNIDFKQFNKLPAIQLSDVIKLFSGVVIKDYGGVGGMKTVSVRGFGAQHTMVAYDGIAVTDCQTGQIDIAKFSLQNVEQLALNNGFEDDIFIPARLFASAALINIRTHAPTFTEQKPVNIDLHCTGGSFGYFNPTFRIENRIVKKKNSTQPLLSSSLDINYLQSNGNYPFTIFYGRANDSTSVERRKNSDVKTFNAEGNLYFQFNAHSKLNFKIYYYQAERGLPGAVILYNTQSKQRLSDQNAFAQAHYENRFNAKFAYQVNAKFNFSFQHYLDPEYHNLAGCLNNRYWQRELYLANTFLYSPIRRLSFSISNDLIYNNMNTNSTDFEKPERLSFLTALSGFLDTRHVNIRLGLLHTYVANRVQTGTAADNINRFAPAAGLSIKPLQNENLVIRLFYKNIFRLPTFNDLYYREVGNLNLLPENTHQCNLGIVYERSWKQKKIDFSITLDGYYNWVKDKIIAIPNKNLFVWTMLNLGKVTIGGLDGRAMFNYLISPEVAVGLNASYSLQHAIDVTDPFSKTYKHQVPYTPLHSGAISVSVDTKWINLTYLMLFSGKRYTLQQNTDANLLSAYIDHSITVGKDFRIKEILLGYKIELLNLANRHYEIVKNYPMQGRSFRAGIHFKW